MRASKVTQYGIPTSEGGRACQFNVGEVKVFLTGPDSGDTRFVAESLAAYWNQDSEPDPAAFCSDASGVFDVCARLAKGPVLSPRYSVGAWTPAVDDGFSWAVLDAGGYPLMLAHDSFEVALYFCRLEDGTVPPPPEDHNTIRLAS